jgi:hypothetical protein
MFSTLGLGNETSWRVPSGAEGTRRLPVLDEEAPGE